MFAWTRRKPRLNVASNQKPVQYLTEHRTDLARRREYLDFSTSQPGVPVLWIVIQGESQGLVKRRIKMTLHGDRSPSTAASSEDSDNTDTMWADAFMCTLAGPIPTTFTGDRAQAQQFLEEFTQLEQANLRHPLITRPALRVELALLLIRGHLTDLWRHTVRCGQPGEEVDEDIWDEFYDSFCTTWIDEPPAPATQTPSPPVPANNEDVFYDCDEYNSIPVPIQTTSPPGPEHKEEEDWTLFAPCVAPAATTTSQDTLAPPITRTRTGLDCDQSNRTFGPGYSPHWALLGARHHVCVEGAWHHVCVVGARRCVVVGAFWCCVGVVRSQPLSVVGARQSVIVKGTRHRVSVMGAQHCVIVEGAQHRVCVKGAWHHIGVMGAWRHVVVVAFQCCIGVIRLRPLGVVGAQHRVGVMAFSAALVLWGHGAALVLWCYGAQHV
ncbi:hypothetical protein EDB89DRAFT_1901953 [Lactarius sanguifluus]|nr:hypothetical protein EDB89DRAFT_1901953 [Lactarius sanguifluus]